MATRHTVVLVAFDGVQLLDIAGPADVFDTATRGLGMQDRALLTGDFSTPFDDVAAKGYRVLIATLGARPVRTSAGVLIVADLALENLTARDVDTFIVAGTPFIDEPLADLNLVHQIQRIASDVGRIGSVCSGAFLLAAAGVLDQKRATTHWAGGQELARRFPTVTVEPDRIFIRDGHIITSAGVTSGIDMSLAMIEEDFGSDLALKVARWLVMFLRRSGGQSQYSERLALPPGLEPVIQAVVDDIVAEPAGDHRVPTLARRMSLSERHISRVFREQTGVTPGRFVERVRVEAARDLLERTPALIEQIAEESGFGSPETLRRAFIRVLGVSPSAYRERFPGDTSGLAPIAARSAGQ